VTLADLDGAETLRPLVVRKGKPGRIVLPGRDTVVLIRPEQTGV
jgi:hypothetical protein